MKCSILKNSRYLREKREKEKRRRKTRLPTRRRLIKYMPAAGESIVFCGLSHFYCFSDISSIILHTWARKSAAPATPNKELFMATETHPFGISLEFIEEWQRKQKNVKFHNEPLRDVEKQDVWDFLDENVPENKSIFTPEVIAAIKGED
jgi:hypothetical protein